MYDFFMIIWNIIMVSFSEWFMTSDLAFLMYCFLICAVVCYFINLIKLLRKY